MDGWVDFNTQFFFVRMDRYLIFYKLVRSRGQVQWTRPLLPDFILGSIILASVVLCAATQGEIVQLEEHDVTNTCVLYLHTTLSDSNGMCGAGATPDADIQ